MTPRPAAQPGLPTWTPCPEKFVDAVLWAEAKGIFEGGEDGRLRPMSELTRAEFATVLMRWCTLYA